ncbi:unnamed protein product [Amoebophrya sp. A120]|nr:unnamed protein product [Amoebophrya sp. A120]|eukprot:GSA120T00000235001.1
MWIVTIAGWLLWIYLIGIGTLAVVMDKDYDPDAEFYSEEVEHDGSFNEVNVVKRRRKEELVTEQEETRVGEQEAKQRPWGERLRRWLPSRPAASSRVRPIFSDAELLEIANSDRPAATRDAILRRRPNMEDEDDGTGKEDGTSAIAHIPRSSEHDPRQTINLLIEDED